ncbi:transposase [Streptomyces inhibens]|uniref:transposase n=1 Tax=Streptomyces inhibens TaxID=2293571 RepID=UPI00402AC61C
MGIAHSAAAAARDGPTTSGDRMMLNGIVWKFRTGVAWRDVPDRYGSWATLYTLSHARLRSHGAPTALGQRRHIRPYAAGGAGQGGRGRRHRLAGPGWLHDRPRPPAHLRRTNRGLRSQRLGRSRDGATSKIHLAVDGRGRPLALTLTGGDTKPTRSPPATTRPPTPTEPPSPSPHR